MQLTILTATLSIALLSTVNSKCVIIKLSLAKRKERITNPADAYTHFLFVWVFFERCIEPLRPAD